MLKSRSGFTIVELLIVIVVIAILAAITVVAYNGIQARAKFAQQVTEIDKIGKAVQLWTAEKGTSLWTSGSGHGGNGIGSFTATGGAYATTSIHTLLEDAGYLPGFNPTASGIDGILLSPCTSHTNSRWIVYATLTPAPSISVADQISQTGCTSGYLTLYTDSSYARNFIKAY